MKYDVDDIAIRVEAAKKKFKITLATCVLLILTAIFIAVCFPETTVVFVCAVTVIASAVYFISFVKRNNPLITFSRGFSGENVKEHEYVIGGTRVYRYGDIRYRYHPARHKGDVYVRCEDGEIAVVTCLPKKHLDIFEIGDTLVCYPGTRYPNVYNRDVTEQPCPVCGFVNREGTENCENCGLKALKCK